MKIILVIEDNAAVRENTVELLQLNNYQVLAAEDGVTGYEMAKKHQPNLILCDMMMPGSDGRKFLQLAKADKTVQHIPLVFFSAGTPSVEIQKGLIRHSNGFLKKPFSEGELLAIIKREIDAKERAN